MNKINVLLILGLFGIVAILGYLAFELRGESKECLASPVQYWLSRAREHTGNDYSATITGGNTIPVLITEYNVTPLRTKQILGDNPNYTLSVDWP